MVWWLALLLFAGTTVLSALLQRRPREVQPSALGDFTFPTAQEGRAIPVVYGTVKLAAPNVVWYGDMLVQAIKKKSGGFFGLFAKMAGMKIVVARGEISEMPKDEIWVARTGQPSAGEILAKITNLAIPVGY